MSKEHKEYIKKIKKNNMIIKTSQILIAITFIVTWQILANKNLINTFIFSSPKNIINTILTLHNNNNLYNHIIVTVSETVISFILSIFLGLIIASIMWYNKFIAKIIEPYLTILNSLPKIALGPIIIIWMGSGISSIIFMALLISLIITIITIYQSFIETDPLKIRLMHSLKANKFQIYTKLIIPHNINTIISTLKINISLNLIGVIMGEFLTSKQGIGYLIMYGSQVFNLNLVMTGILLLSIIASTLYYIILCVEKSLIK